MLILADYMDCAQLCVAGDLTSCSLDEYFTPECQLCPDDNFNTRNHELTYEDGWYEEFRYARVS